MGELLGTIGTAAGVFAGTNVDDIIVLTVLFLSARAAGKPRPWHIWTGQYVGIGLLVAVSAVAALGLTIVPDRWVGLLGLVPFALGARGLSTAIRSRDDDEPPSPAVATGLLSVAGVTIANGADNISVYTPTFRTVGVTSSLITVAVFAVGVAAWCVAASWIGSLLISVNSVLVVDNHSPTAAHYRYVRKANEPHLPWPQRGRVPTSHTPTTTRPVGHAATSLVDLLIQVEG